jgi:DNA (cytosine-5)-methyltransferase 1
MNYLSVCSGIEAASVAWKPLGWNPRGFSEIEAFPISVLKHHYPTTPNYGDITNHENWKISQGDIDIIVGGTPCQSFSTAGRRLGLEDPRGRIMHAYLGLVRRLLPAWVVWENVPGVLSSGGGRDFASFIGPLARMGYTVGWRVLDAQWFGVPQRRRRVFVVASLGTPGSHQVLFERESLFGDPPASGASRQGNSGAIADCAATVSSKWHKGTGGPSGDECQNLTVFRKSRRAQSVHDHETWVPASVSNTLNQFDVGERDTHGVLTDLGVRRLTPVECERLQGFPDNWTLVPHKGKPASDGPRYKAIGNSMAVPVMRWIGQRISKLERTGNAT